MPLDMPTSLSLPPLLPLAVSLLWPSVHPPYGPRGPRPTCGTGGQPGWSGTNEQGRVLPSPSAPGREHPVLQPQLVSAALLPQNPAVALMREASKALAEGKGELTAVCRKPGLRTTRHPSQEKDRGEGKGKATYLTLTSLMQHWRS